MTAGQQVRMVEESRQSPRASSVTTVPQNMSSSISTGLKPEGPHKHPGSQLCRQRAAQFRESGPLHPWESGQSSGGCYSRAGGGLKREVPACRK